MMTTSRERREAVQRSMVKAHGLFWDGEHANFDEDWSDPVIRAEMEELADAALSAALPDYDAFMDAVKARDEVLLRYWCGDDDGNVADEAEVDATRDALIALVFGGRDQEGAEYE